MLGEDHSLLHDFPKMKHVIERLTATDEVFASDAKRYHALDKEIRKLEMRDSPIDDTDMRQLKYERAGLKDSLFHRMEAGG